MWRVMIKQIDQQSIAAGTRRELPEEEHRVRIEVTLDFRELHKLGITTLAELKTFRYQTFQRGFFQFRLPTFRGCWAQGKQPALHQGHRSHSTFEIPSCRCRRSAGDG